MLDHGVTGWTCGGERTTPPDMPQADAEALSRALLVQPVLVIEDEAMIAWTLESLLEEMGFASITIAARGEDAIAAAAQVQPGLIVSDINLGSRAMDGIAATTAICRTHMVPVLFITGHAGADETARIGQDLPDAMVIRKPISFADLKRAIARVSQPFKPN